jgi:hypothetical protein
MSDGTHAWYAIKADVFNDPNTRTVHLEAQTWEVGDQPEPGWQATATDSHLFAPGGLRFQTSVVNQSLTDPPYVHSLENFLVTSYPA